MRPTDRGKYRRSASLLLYWQGGDLIFENFALRKKISADPIACSILDYCGEWRSVSDVAANLKEYERSSVAETLLKLFENGLLERSDRKPDPRTTAMEKWAAWNPAAGFLHFSTKNTLFGEDQGAAIRELQRRARQEPMPLPVKHYPAAKRIKLRATRSAGTFQEVLRNRRTWRKYGPEPVPLETLAEILQLTFGIQGWAKIPKVGWAAMKTSPSCGGLHPVEAYVLAQRVQGLGAGLYHYNTERHQLERLRAGIPRKALEKNLGNQWWFAKAAFLVIMSAVVARTRWKYDSPRVYRGILIEAGHLCQTFCLTATWKGLAPFSTIAYADTQWEKWLGLDGVSESVLYIAGAGTRPKALKSAHLGAL
jgi:SagB-type dehydrogenase family enzyme